MFWYGKKAYQISLNSIRDAAQRKEYHPSEIAKLHNELTNAELNYQDMIRIANDLSFEAKDEIGHKILSRKTNVTKACEKIATLSFHLCGGFLLPISV